MSTIGERDQPSALGDNGPVVVVGGGPCGSLLSIYLAEQGHEVTLYESRQDMRQVDVDSGRSINLALAMRGIVPLVEVGVIERADAITIPMKGRMIHAEDSDRLTLQPYGVKPHEVIHSISRGELNAILLDRAEETGRVQIEFDHRCRGVDFEQRTLALTGPDGTELMVPFGNLFGTDGAGSDIREAMLAVNGGSQDIDWLGHGYKEITLPPATGGGFQLDPNALHIWPRGEFMLIALANPEGDFTVTLFAPNEGRESFEALQTPAQVMTFFSGEFPDFAELVPDLTEQFFENPTGRLATLRATGWSHRDQVVVVGDAAHAIVPFHGQGMNLAMESARALAKQLDRNRDNVAAAFRAFEVERKPSADAIADMALENYVEMRAGVIDPDYVIKRELALELERRHPDRISPRYNMVMFSTMPYAEARDRAAIQGRILTELTAGLSDVGQVDFQRAAALIETLPPLPELDPLALPDALSVT